MTSTICTIFVVHCCPITCVELCTFKSKIIAFILKNFFWNSRPCCAADARNFFLLHKKRSENSSVHFDIQHNIGIIKKECKTPRVPYFNCILIHIPRYLLEGIAVVHGVDHYWKLICFSPKLLHNQLAQLYAVYSEIIKKKQVKLHLRINAKYHLVTCTVVSLTTWETLSRNWAAIPGLVRPLENFLCSAILALFSN
jgi:hypothetical protein